MSRETVVARRARKEQYLAWLYGRRTTPELTMVRDLIEILQEEARELFADAKPEDLVAVQSNANVYREFLKLLERKPLSERTSPRTE